jgi:hypothetical protein
LGQIIDVFQIMDLAGEVAAERKALGAHNLPEGVPVAAGDFVQNSRDFRRLQHFAPTFRQSISLLFYSPLAARSHSRLPMFETEPDSHPHDFPIFL